MKEKVLITAALPYINNVPHMGHIVGSHLPADVFYRFQRSFGRDAIFIGGSDEFGTASMIAARELNTTPKILVDSLKKVHKEIYDKLSIAYTNFSGTSLPLHANVTQDFFRKLKDNDFVLEESGNMLFCEKDNIFLPDRFVTGTCPKCGAENANADQCEVCGSVFSPEELLKPKCKFCGSTPEMKPSKHLFFDLTKISNKLSEWIESQKNVWRPHVYAEAKRWITEGLKPRAITRDLNWGVPVPVEGYEHKVFYVWFDAPIGYISFVKELGEKQYEEYWKNPSTKIYNFIGKDNIPFHTVFFPAMLLANGTYNMPYNVVGLNFLNYEGKKFSKSKKWGVFCQKLLTSDIDIDALRAYLVTVIPETKDSDFKWDSFKDNTNSELVGKFGNLYNRSLNMIQKNFNGQLDFEITNETILSDEDKELIASIKEYPEKIANLFENCEFREAYKAIMAFATVGNVYIEKQAPWTLIKNGNMEAAKKVLYLALNLAKSLTIVASPVLPTRCKDIWINQLNFAGDPTADDMWKEAGKISVEKSHKILEPKPLFARVDDEILEKLKNHFSEPFEISEFIVGDKK
ncbi:MAG: methionine--tRNA ligase [Clostridia bacterium]